MKNKKIEKTDIYFAVLLVGAAFVYLSRIRLGFVDMDEGFYLTVPYRLIQGDCLLTEEWHVTQLVGFLIYPILKLYLFFFKNVEGIYLAFRHVYLLLLFSVTIVSYIFLKKRDKILAIPVSIIFCLFTPFYLKTLSYNTIGFLAVWLLVVVLTTEMKRVALKYAVVGGLLAVTVLCNPYMLILYIIYSVICIWRKEKSGIFNGKSWGLVTVGAGSVLVLFLAFLFSRTSVIELVRNIPYIFLDPAHKSKSVLDFFKPILDFIVWFKWYFLIFAMGILSVLFSSAKRKKKEILGSLMIISSVLLILLALFKTAGIGKHAIMLPLTLLGGTAFVFTKEKSWELFYGGWLVGIIYAMCMNLSSNQGIYVICNACAVSSCISIFLIRDFYAENKVQMKKMYSFTFLLVIQIVAEIYVGINYIHWEEDVASLKFKIEEGPLRGIYTTEEKKAAYEKNCINIDSLGDLRNKNILFFNHFPAGYLIAEEATNGAFSAWMPEYRELDNEKFLEYYLLHPEKIPEVIYVDSQARCEWSEEDWNIWCEEYNYIREPLPEGGSVLFLQ